MRITCSQCGSLHIITDEKASGTGDFIMICDGCGRKIKTVRCTECGTFYSITFDYVKNTRYNVRCKKCLTEFIIHFPVEHTHPSVPEQTVKDEPPAGEDRPPVPQAPVETRRHTRSGDSRGSIYTVTGFFDAIGSAFTPLKIITVSGVIAAAIALLSLLEALISLLPIAGGMSHSLLHLSSLKNAALFLIIYLLGASFVSGVTIDEINGVEKTALKHRLRGAVGHIFPVFAGTASIILLTELALLVFGRIPLVGTLLYALLFLPVYVLSLVLILLIVVGFWFYPPIIAARVTGLPETLRVFYRFIVRHNFSLLLHMGMLATATLAASGVLYLIHRAGLAITIALSRIVLGSEVSVLFSSIPPGFSMLTGLLPAVSFPGMSLLSSSGMSVTQWIGAFILGTVLSALTILLLSMFISVAATLSTRVYHAMEEDARSDEKSAVYLLGLLIMLLVLLLLMRKFLPL